jgi:hypothetical protein
MERNTRLLTYLLAIQIAVIGALWYRAGTQADAAAGSLLTLDRSALTAIEIAENDTTSVRLEKGADGWVLPALDGLPAETEKVTGLIEKLEDADAAWPVARSEASANRFEVTEAKYQRRIRFFAGDDAVGELYLGTSPGFRRVHARRADSSDVYAITFAVFEAPAKAEEWLDKTLLQAKGVLSRIVHSDGWALAKEGDAWLLADRAEGETTDGDAARDIVSKVNDLRVLGRADAPPAADATPAFTLTLTTDAGERALRFYRADDKSDFVVNASDRPGQYRVAAYIGEALDVDRAVLLAKAAPSTDSSVADEDPASTE